MFKNQREGFRAAKEAAGLNISQEKAAYTKSSLHGFFHLAAFWPIPSLQLGNWQVAYDKSAGPEALFKHWLGSYGHVPQLYEGLTQDWDLSAPVYEAVTKCAKTFAHGQKTVNFTCQILTQTGRLRCCLNNPEQILSDKSQ